MELKNGYRVIYEVKDNAVAGKPGPFYGSKILQNVEGQKLMVCNSDTGEVLVNPGFKLIYAKDANLFGSIKNYPTENDVRIFIKDESGAIVFGEGQEVPLFGVSFKPVANVVFGGAGRYEEGAEVVLTVRPAEGYMFGEGNAPKHNSEPFVEEEGVFKLVLTMPAEAVEVDVQGIVVVEKPVARDVYYVAATEVPSTVDSSWKFASKEGDEVACQFEGNSEQVYPAFAVRSDLGELEAMYMPAMPSLNILDTNYSKSDITFLGKNYFLYVSKEAVMDEQAFEIDICWKARA